MNWQQYSFPDDVSQELFASQLDVIFSSDALSTYVFKIYLICEFILIFSTSSLRRSPPSHSFHPSFRRQMRKAPFVGKVLEIGGEKMNSKNISDFEKGDSEEMCSCQQLWYFQSNSHPDFSLPSNKWKNFSFIRFFWWKSSKFFIVKNEFPEFRRFTRIHISTTKEKLCPLQMSNNCQLPKHFATFLERFHQRTNHFTTLCVISMSICVFLRGET